MVRNSRLSHLEMVSTSSAAPLGDDVSEIELDGDFFDQDSFVFVEIASSVLARDSAARQKGEATAESLAAGHPTPPDPFVPTALDGVPILLQKYPPQQAEKPRQKARVGMLLGGVCAVGVLGGILLLTPETTKIAPDIESQASAPVPDPVPTISFAQVQVNAPQQPAQEGLAETAGISPDVARIDGVSWQEPSRLEPATVTEAYVRPQFALPVRPIVAFSVVAQVIPETAFAPAVPKIAANVSIPLVRAAQLLVEPVEVVALPRVQYVSPVQATTNEPEGSAKPVTIRIVAGNLIAKVRRYRDNWSTVVVANRAAATRNGLIAGDILLVDHLTGTPLDTPTALADLIARARSEDIQELGFAVIRNGTISNGKITIAEPN